MRCFVDGATLWWELPSLGPMLCQASYKKPAHFWGNRWTAWQEAMKRGFPPNIGLRKAHDRRAASITSWEEVWPERSASTAGLVWLFSHLAVGSQHRHSG